MRRPPPGSVVVRRARRWHHRGSEREQDGQLRSQTATVPKMPGTVALASEHERMHGKAVIWTGESAQLLHATVRLGNRRTVHLSVERMGGTGWDWQVWVQAGWTWARYGLAETAGHAKEQAERVLAGLMRSDADGNAPLGPNCQSTLFPQRCV